MADDIVTRLRHIHMELTVDDYDDVITEAADEIERLRAEVERLTKYGPKFIAMYEQWTTERALSDQLAEALRERESSHYSWCPANDSDEIAKSLWPDGCPFCAALAAYDAARKD